MIEMPPELEIRKQRRWLFELLEVKKKTKC